jgi:CheY-like chemotaxis protein
VAQQLELGPGRVVEWSAEHVSLYVTQTGCLVVDDLGDTAWTLAAILSVCGVSHVAIATTGQAALEQAADDPPDVVLLDLGLPDLTGWEVARCLREQVGALERRALVVAVTGYASEDARRRSAEAGVDLHLVKPVEPALLIGLLRRFARVLTPGLPADAQE